MNMAFFNRITKSNASTNCRKGNCDFALENPEYLKDLLAYGFVSFRNRLNQQISL